MNTHRAFIPHPTAIADDPFAQQFGTPLPRAMRDEALGMTWQAFSNSYSPTNGPIRFGRWSALSLGAGRSEFKATLGLGNAIAPATAIACGPVAALTAMLYDAGFALEILEFHQQSLPDGRTVTFLRCEHAGRRHWAFGIAGTATDSSVRAMIAGANLLHG
ncbi:2-isopropylmalate synthase [Rhodococcus kronopolitis]|uniref:2-isopropylmalate synthase n=1 Tax=Rhodococcus kronopolitis TaxID=1460226 RepID=A0ABV9FRQ3_9NOCA